MTAIHRRFLVRRDELDGTEDDPAPIVKAARDPQPRPVWVIAAAHGVLGCARCGASMLLVPATDKVVDEYLRDVRAFVRTHCDCKAREGTP